MSGMLHNCHNFNIYRDISLLRLLYVFSATYKSIFQLSAPNLRTFFSFSFLFFYYYFLLNVLLLDFAPPASSLTLCHRPHIQALHSTSPEYILPHPSHITAAASLLYSINVNKHICYANTITNVLRSCHIHLRFIIITCIPFIASVRHIFQRNIDVPSYFNECMLFISCNQFRSAVSSWWRLLLYLFRSHFQCVWCYPNIPLPERLYYTRSPSPIHHFATVFTVFIHWGITLRRKFWITLLTWLKYVEGTRYFTYI